MIGFSAEPEGEDSTSQTTPGLAPGLYEQFLLRLIAFRLSWR
jgi:hypothetical protein